MQLETSQRTLPLGFWVQHKEKTQETDSMGCGRVCDSLVRTNTHCVRQEGLATQNYSLSIQPEPLLPA
jgi:hypothetical protein